VTYPGEVGEVSLVYRPVESVPGADRLDLFLCRRRAEHDLDRVAGDLIGEDERDRHDPE